MDYPKIIQGGMGVAISDWGLARAVSKSGQLGVVSGVALEIVMVRRLQDGDVGGHIHRALNGFPFRDMATRALEKYFIPGGKAEDKPYATIPIHKMIGSTRLHELCILGTFAEVFPRRRHQLSGEDPVAPPSVHLWRHAGRRRIRDHGCGHPDHDPRGP